MDFTGKQTEWAWACEKEIRRRRTLSPRMGSSRRVDLIGKKYGYWSVLSLAVSPGRPEDTHWLCRCDCGTEKVIRSASLRNGTSKSCGCMRFGPMIRKCNGKLMTGPNHPDWKGGRRIDKNGYILVNVYDHPYTSKKNGRGVFEHRLVMENHIGRCLLPEETVHHRNGVRDDNRIENLELWAGNHGSGQRVSDKIQHAIAILQRYRPEMLAPH